MVTWLGRKMGWITISLLFGMDFIVMRSARNFRFHRMILETLFCWFVHFREPWGRGLDG